SLLIFVIVIVLSFSSALYCNDLPEMRCPDPDWYEFGDFCYKPFTDQKTWHAARTSCRKLGADLVSLLSLKEQITSDMWIGLNDLEIQGYQWSDGSFVSHTNWGYGEPNNHEGREDCVEMVTTNNGSSWWNDLNCDAHQDWICMIPKGKNLCVLL
uniref:C-type lectin domain-containing protein n=1 Tax=Paramormyrops kingsleyae TaxID=1676925 RepID=A0A3B3S381_9TELE